jgi:hypothetical protein
MRKTMAIGIVLLLTIVVFTGSAMNVSAESSYFAGGSGTESDPYQISNVVELQNMNYDLDAHYILVNDIDASITCCWDAGAGWYPISTFSGTFDGQGYIISDLYIYRPLWGFGGLFGTIQNGEIKNVGLVNVDITTRYLVGGLAAENRFGSQISNCFTTGTVTGRYYVGGLVGKNFFNSPISNSYSTCTVTGYESNTGGLVGYNEYNSPISNCYSTGDVTGQYHVGGLVGTNYNSAFSDCYTTGDVTGYLRVAGLVSYNYYGPTSNCYTNGDVSGYSHVGGLIGTNYNSLISNCYSSGAVTGTYSLGGLIARNGYIQISNSFWDTEASGQSSSAGGTGKTTSEMMQQATFTGWDFVNLWEIVEDVTYPYFWWTNSPPVADAGANQIVFVGETFTLDGSGSYDPYGTILYYDWDFNDPYTTGNSEIITHKFWQPGIYPVTLTVSDIKYETDSDTVFISVITIEKATENLILDIEDLELLQGTKNSMTSILENAIKSMEKDNDISTINQLEAFINLVDNGLRGSKLTDEEADALIEITQEIITNMN